jgi:hypothetical protein
MSAQRYANSFDISKHLQKIYFATNYTNLHELLVQIFGKVSDDSYD